MASIYNYQVYGLKVESWIPFPELPPARLNAPADAVFRLGEVPARLPDDHPGVAWCQPAPGRLLSWVDGVARFLVVDGREIIVQPAPGVAESDLRLFLLCTPMGGLLLQRGLLPLHASAIVTPRGAVVFMGDCGAGKSTLAACFRQRGFRVQTDDISVVSADGDGSFMVSPGYPQMKLWPDAVARLGEDAAALTRLRPNQEKRTFRFLAEFNAHPLPLAQIYLLKIGPVRAPVLQAIQGTEKLAALLRHTYRSELVRGLGVAAPHFQTVAQVADRIPVAEIIRPETGGGRDKSAPGDRGLLSMDASVAGVADLIAQDLGLPPARKTEREHVKI